MKQVTEPEKDSAAQGCPVCMNRLRLTNSYPGFQLRFPSLTLTLKALPHAVSQLYLWTFGTVTLVVSFKDFLVAASIGNQSNVFKV